MWVVAALPPSAAPDERLEEDDVEHERPVALVHYHAKARPRRNTVDDEPALDVWQLHCRAGGERPLEGAGGVVGIYHPHYASLRRPDGERPCDGVTVADELTVVVACKPEEAVQRSTNRRRHWPCLYCLDLCQVHGDAILGNDVVEVCHSPWTAHRKRTCST